MNTLAIEINDAGLTVADGSGVLAVEPGYASLDDGEFLAGDTAYAQARLRPRQTSNAHWENLSLDPDSAGIEGVGSSAELAFRQLDGLWNRFGGADRDAVLVVPGHYSREQLGLLLGLVQECRMPVRAMVNAAAAASARPWPGRQLLHLDVHLHRFSATVLKQGDGVAAEPEQALSGVGLVSLMDLWAKRVAELFVLQTRFDPFHRADSEQLVHDRLPESLRALHSDEDTELALNFGGAERMVRLTRKQVLGVVAGAWRAVVQFVAQQREPGASLTLQVSHRVGHLPGLTTELKRLDDTRIVTLPHDAAVMGALACARGLESASGQVKLLKRLPWRQEPEQGEPATVQEVEPTAETASDAEAIATHVVHRGVALPVGQSALHIGRESVNGRRTIVIDDQHQAVSRSHCEVVRRDGELCLKDSSRFGTFVNEKRVLGETVLRPADVIRVGSPGEELHVIVVEAHDGP